MPTNEFINNFIDTYRSQCLWYMDKNYYPTDYSEYIKVLRQIESHGDREAFKQAKELEKWLLQNSSELSVN